MTTDLLPNFFPALPEIFLLAFSCILLLLSVLQKNKEIHLIYNGSIGGLALTWAMLYVSSPFPQLAFNDFFTTNQLTQISEIIIITISSLILLMIPIQLKREQLFKAELPIVITLATLGMMIMISANNFLTLYLGMELQSLCLYILVAIARQQLPAIEAGLKYFVLGTLASIFILYGSSLLYGLTGSIFFQEIAQQIQLIDSQTPVLLAVCTMVLVGIGFKLSFVPFHMWTPDVYEGSPTPITAFLASAPKIAAFCMLLQVLHQAFPSLTKIWPMIIMAMAMLSILLGAFAALFQNNFKRVLAYSTISHMGFAGMALVSQTPAAIEAVLIYLIVYVVMTLGIFAGLLSLRRGGKAIETIDDLKGLSQDAPLLSLCIMILLFSLAGLPPFAGFFAKLGVLKVTLAAGYHGMVILAVLASVVSTAYYLKIIKICYFDAPLGGQYALQIDRNFSKRTLAVLFGATSLVTFYLLLPKNIFAPLKIASTFFLGES